MEEEMLIIRKTINGESVRYILNVSKEVNARYIKIRKDKGNKYYTYEIQETELLPERPIDYGTGVDEKQSQFPDTDSNSISMANLLKNAVKTTVRNLIQNIQR